MFKKIFLPILIIFVSLLIVISLQPEDFKISRSLSISAAPEVIFEQVNNLHKWDAWSPWAKLDPNATNSFSGPDAGVGAKMSWSGNNDVGAGAMSIIESQPSEMIKLQLDFLRPMQSTNYSQFGFKPSSDGKKTTVTWTMSGKNNFIAKAFGMIMNCDKIVGDQFEKGLSTLKNIIEKI